MDHHRMRVCLIGVVAAVALAACGSSSKATTPSSTVPLVTTPSSARATLLPASVAPVSDECALPLTTSADGNVSPLLCTGGGVNQLAWAHYAQGKVRNLPITASRTMGLGKGATAASVYAAMCSDYAKVYGTNPLTMSAEKLAAAYYGWTFTDSRISQFLHQSCPAS